MNYELRYLGKSGLHDSALSFAPNLARPKVFFDAELKNPLRFREAMSALHDVVIGDLRFKRRDKTAYEAWKAEQQREESELRKQLMTQAKEEVAAKLGKDAPPPNLEADFRKMHGVYWTARRTWAWELQKNDPELFRHLVPCDPVVTVAPDSVFFECFAKDESSYGCLFVDRDAFIGDSGFGLGTTNVDYSLALYDHFQSLRTYRATRLLVDPTGFEVKVEGREEYREEKIDLPPSWLRGFGQLQAAMGLPTRTVELSVDAVYSLLAYLKRHREKTGPRSLKFQLTPGKPASFLIEPWNLEVKSRGAAYVGERPEEIKVWGRRRLMVLSRVLPLADRVTVQLLGSGLPSIWTAHLGEMRFVVALSGWTTNDWTSGVNLELLSGGFQEDPQLIERVRRALEADKRATLAELSTTTQAPREPLLGALHRLCKQGQVVYDFAGGVYRWRPVLPVALSDALLGPEPEELTRGRALFLEKQVKLGRQEPLSQGRRLVAATVGKESCESIFDADGAFSKAKCSCSHFYKHRLRGGPCRHLLALRLTVQSAEKPAPPKNWIH
jgi:hypothetical protein